MEADFSGWATKTGLKCSDGRTIMPNAFKHQDKQQVPLVWMHQHNEPENVLGYAILEHQATGVRAHAFFNDTPSAIQAKALVEHGDVSALSIFANQLKEQGKNVTHGDIKEVSLVLSGANPGANIDTVNIAHSDGSGTEAIIYTGLPLNEETSLEHADETGADIFDTLNEKQKNLFYFMLGAADGVDLSHSDIKTEDDKDENDDSENDSTDETDDENENDDSEDSSDEAENDDNIQHSQEDKTMTRNLFESHGEKAGDRKTLTHDQLATIVRDAKKPGMTLKESFLAHADEYGIGNIDFLFPDAKTIADSPEFVSRRMEWVTSVINGTNHSPFSRIKSLSADITLDEARAKGYVKATLKKEEFFALSKRVTTPTTIYKKQKLDRDDIIDITDLDVVAWLKAEMRVMLDEELARAILIGDGREVDDEDKISETNIRPIAFDDDFYADKTIIPANVTGDALVEAILRSRPNYRGSGNPTMYCTEDLLTDLILVKDKMGRRLYPTKTELAAALRVSDIITVDPMEDVSTDGGDLLAILVNVRDYTVGADKGGAVSMFDDFDIDYNQYKYLIETRVSGALTKYKSALVYSRASGTQVTPAVPTFNTSTGVLTVPSTTGVTYKNQDTDATLTAGAQTAIASGATVSVVAVPNTGYYFPHNFDADWDFTRA